ncbi:MAG: helix-turn-helix domain-containing protein [Castellaniella sp.]|uniref:winged helix-turn-helix transcriptional regulator n=1 Tax=Castellaniella sp. TaxID=1955812 RepID=UPI003C75E59B
MAKSRHSRFDCSPGCAVEAAIGLIDGKWKSVVLFHLLGGTLRFNEIRRQIVNVSPRMLTRQLRELEEDGLIERTVYAQVPPRVDYCLSPLGHSMTPILLALKSWGDEHIGLYGKPLAHTQQPAAQDSCATPA